MRGGRQSSAWVSWPRAPLQHSSPGDFGSVPQARPRGGGRLLRASSAGPSRVRAFPPGRAAPRARDQQNSAAWQRALRRRARLPAAGRWCRVGATAAEGGPRSGPGRRSQSPPREVGPPRARVPGSSGRGRRGRSNARTRRCCARRPPRPAESSHAVELTPPPPPHAQGQPAGAGAAGLPQGMAGAPLWLERAPPPPRPAGQGA